jgi:antitoxin HicB
MAVYAARLARAAEGGYLVTFRDMPEAITQGASRAHALERAQDALIHAVDFYFEDKRPVPVPSRPEAGEELVALPPELAAKVLLANSELARR